MIAVVTRSPTPELKLMGQQDTNIGARRRPFQEELLFMIFPYNTGWSGEL